MNQAITRRRFLETALGTGVVGGLLPRAWRAQARNGIPYRVLGKTGERVSCIGLGGYHIGIQGDEEKSIRIIRTAIEEGSISWTTVGTTTEVRVRSAWAKPCARATGRKRS
jgi:hypothetical protein